MGFWDFYLRWRHSKGFGVHSPYAYKFVTDVVNPGKYGYYAYKRLDRILLQYNLFSSSKFNSLAFIIRILIFLKSKRIVSDSPNERLPRIVGESLNIPFRYIEKKVSFKFREGDLLIIQSESYNLDILDSAIQKKIPVLALTPGDELRKELERPLSHGVLFNWKDKLLLIPRPDMAYVSYIL